MSLQPDTIQQLRNEVLGGLLDRRSVLKRGLALGLSAPILAGLLAACGDEDDDPTATAGSGQADATATEGSGDEPTATTGEGAATETEGSEGEPTADSGSDAPRGGQGKATLLYWQAPTILNPHLAQGTKDNHASRVCLEPLHQFDANTEPVLYLAAEWPTVDNGLLDPDGTFVIWKLRQGVKWHDGEDFNAEDVVFTYEWITNPDTTATTLGTYAAVDSVELIDEYTVQVNFSGPNPAWFDAFHGAAGCILPEHYFRDYTGAEARDAPGNLMPIGTGPFKVREFKPGDVVLYDLFPDYWEPGKPHLDEVEIKGGGDAVSAARAVMQSGEADWAWNLQIEPQILSQMQEGGQGELVLGPGNSAERIMVNFADPKTEVDGAFSEPSTQHPVFQHLQARQAINLAIRRDVITEQLYGPGNEPTAYILNVPERLKPQDLTWEYNLEAAQALLDEAGIEPGYNLLYSTSVNSARQKNQEIVKEDLEKLGFVVELKSIDSAVYFASDAGNPDTYAHFYADLTMYTNGPSNPYPISWAERFRSDDIAQKSNSWSGTNMTRYFNPEFDALHDQAKVEIDEQRQIEIWDQMMRMPYDDVVEIPIVWRGSVAAKSNRLVIEPANMTNWGDTNPCQDLKNWTFSE